MNHSSSTPNYRTTPLFRRLLPWEYAVRNMGRARSRLVLTVTGSFLVVLLILLAGGFVRGVQTNLKTSGSADNVLLLAAGSEESVQRSEIAPAVASIAHSSMPGIRETLGIAHVSPEIHLEAYLESHDGARRTPLMLRGVTTEALLVHRQVRLVHGSWPERGSDGIAVGRRALRRLDLPEGTAAIGERLGFEGRSWTVSGVIDTGGSVIDSEVWIPLEDLQTVLRRQSLSCVVLTLGEATVPDVELFAAQRLDLNIVAIGEPGYYAQMAGFYRPIKIMAVVAAALIGSGALFGGINTLHAAFAARIREFGTLQVLGFPRRAILISLVQEAVLLSLFGGLLAAAAGLFLLDGWSVRFALGAIGLQVDSLVLSIGLASSLFLGVIGALPPALHCLKPPIPEALRAS